MWRKVATTSEKPPIIEYEEYVFVLHEEGFQVPASSHPLLTMKNMFLSYTRKDSSTCVMSVWRSDRSLIVWLFLWGMGDSLSNNSSDWMTLFLVKHTIYSDIHPDRGLH